MELWTHQARVTSIAVSQAGQVLASGDEQGNLKLLMLRLLDRIIPTPTSTKNAVDKKKGQARQLSSDSSNANAPSSFSQFLPEYKCSLRAHSGGPIFSLQWLPMPSLTTEGSEEEASGMRGTARGRRGTTLWQQAV